MLVKILNWKDYAPKDASRLKAPWWFKWNKEILLSTKYLELGQREVTALLYIGSLACDQNPPDGVINSVDAHVQVFARMTPAELLAACEILSKFGLLAVISETPAKISPENPAKIAPRGEERRGEEKNTTGADAPSAEPPPPSEQRVLDYEHPSVTVPENERPLPKLAALWNELRAPEFGEVKLCTGKRRSACNARWREHSSEEFWRAALARIAASDFCRGFIQPKDRGRPWVANFDWFVRPDTIAKILEGQYDNKGPAGPGGSNPSTPKLSFWARQQANGGNA